MPDTKFSLPALREHLRRYLWIYLIGVALCLLGTSLLWTVTAPRPSIEQTVVVYLADAYSDGEALQDVADDMLARTRPFDDALQEVRFESMMYNENEYASSMLLVTRLAVGEGDAYLASQAVMDALVASGALLPLDEYVADGWLADWGLEPCYAAPTDESGEAGEPFLAGLRLDGMDALTARQAFNNRGACLCVVNNGGNVETTMKALEFMVQDLMEETHAASADTEPAA